MRDESIQAHTISLPWGRLRVYLAGQGPPVLALHGLGGSGRYWEGLMHALGCEVTVVAPDLAGFGASDKPDESYGRTFHLDNLDTMIERLGLGRPRIVAGHSMGGILAALWAARHRESVRSLALVASPYPAARAGPGRWEGRGVWAAVHRALQIAWPVVTLPYRSSLYPRGVVLDYPRHTRTSYWRTAYDLIWNPSLVRELEPLLDMQLAALLLYARDDRQVSVDSADRWARLLPGARMELVDAGGHQVLLHSHFAPLAAWIRENVEGTAE